jgi:hypothetical protein
VGRGIAVELVGRPKTSPNGLSLAALVLAA